MLSRARRHVSRSCGAYSSFPVRSVLWDDRVARMGHEMLAGLGLGSDVGVRWGRLVGMISLIVLPLAHSFLSIEPTCRVQGYPCDLK